MSDKDFLELKNQYNKAVSRIQELDEAIKDKDRMWSEYKSTQEVINGHARKLCEMILAKDRKEMMLGTSKSWHSLSTDELILKAIDSFNSYVAERTKLLSDVMNESGRRGRELESLKEQIGILLTQGNITNANTVESIMENARKVENQKAALSELPHKTQKALSEGKIEVIIEDAEDFSNDDFSDLAALVNTAEQVKLTPNSIPYARSKRTEERIQKITDDVQMAHMVDLTDNIEACEAIHWRIMEAIGVKGLSRYKEIEAYVLEDAHFLKTSVRTATLKLTTMSALNKEKFALPISSQGVFYCLTDIGTRMFKHHFKKEPCVSELHRVIAQHDNAEHGYGILDIQNVLEASGRYTSVSSNNRDKAIDVTLDGRQLKYVPDLICKSVKGYTEYIEYERGTHNQYDFSEKLDKMCAASRFLHIIVPNKKILNVIKPKITEWIKGKDPAFLKHFTLRVGTAYNIKDNTDYPLVYKFSKSLEPVPTANSDIKN